MFDINGRIIRHQEKSEYQVRISRKSRLRFSNLFSIHGYVFSSPFLSGSSGAQPSLSLGGWDKIDYAF